jgi:hypothetical protein
VASLDDRLAELVEEAVARQLSPVLAKLDALSGKVSPPVELLTYQEAGKRMGCHPELVSRAVAEGRLKAVPISPTTKRVCWPPVAVGEGA